MSVESENMTAAAAPVRSMPAVLRHLPYFIAAAIAVFAAATMSFDGYILNILMQATTFAVAVFGLTVVLGLCGQINLAQAAFFGLGAYVVGLGTADYQINFWVCLVAGSLLALAAGALLGMSTLKLGGHYLAMVTISFQQIVTLVMINAIWLTRGPDGVGKIGRPALLQSQQAFLAFCVAALAVIGYLVWHLPDTRIGRAMRAVRDNELAAGVAGIDIFRTKVAAFALSALLGGIGRRTVRGRLLLCQPGPVLLRGVDRLPHHGAAGRRRIADRCCDRHRPADPHSGMAALSQNHPGALSRHLWTVRDSDRALHAGRYLGLRSGDHHQIAGEGAAAYREPGAATRPRQDRRRHGARSDGDCRNTSAASRPSTMWTSPCAVAGCMR